MHPYIGKAMAEARQNELLAQAERHRLVRAARAGRTSWPVRWLHALRRRSSGGLRPSGGGSHRVTPAVNQGRTGGSVEECGRAAVAASRARQALDDAVRQARDNGASWTEIGRAAGMSRQSAHERWGR